MYMSIFFLNQKNIYGFLSHRWKFSIICNCFINIYIYIYIYIYMVSLSNPCLFYFHQIYK